MKRNIIFILITSFLMVNCFPSLDRAILEYVSIFNILQKPNSRPQNGEVEGMPGFSPAPGEFYQAIDVSIQTTLTDSQIFYTLDGTNPSCPVIDSEGNTTTPSNGELYEQPVSIPQPSLDGVYIEAIACGKLNGRNVFTQIASGTFIVTNGLLDPPTRDLAPGIFTTTQTLTLTASGAPPGIEIRYTEDGATPNCASPLYSAPINITSSRTIKAVSCLAGWSQSSILEGYYEITGTVETPEFSIENNTFNNDQNLTLSTNTAGANIRYAKSQGADPNPTLTDCDDGTPYTGPILLNWTNTRVIAIACRENWLDSPVSPMRTYDFTVQDPVISPVGGTYQADINITATTTTNGATIHYNASGVALCSSGTTPVDLVANLPSSNDTTVSARACRDGYNLSNPVTASYTMTGTLPSPTSAPDPSIVQPDPINMTLDFAATSPTGSTIRYTTNGITPDCDSIGSDYSAPILISATTEIRAIDCKLTPLWNPSPPLIATYTIQGPVANPTFSANPGLEGGIYANDQTVTISTATPGADIFYTIGDGSQTDPNCSG
ncbi:MAG: chitobiase/beta-hexosaminidase C-terminal domain-containing protein, partial [Leptospira sp.]|nr:chitobiase/beta-hexosaminidase C-terminal domain-containing protein [Leptospira sp.]